MTFDQHHLRILQNACIEDLPKQMAYLDIPGDPIIAFPEYFLQVRTGRVIFKIEDLPNEHAVLTHLQRVVREQLPLREPEDQTELVYESRDTRVFVTNSVRQLAHALCLPPYMGSRYREVVGNEVRIWQHYYWPPIRWEAEIWVYPAPQAIAVEARWEPEWTFICDLQIKATTPTILVALLNGVLHEIVHVTPSPKRRRGWRRVAK